MMTKNEFINEVLHKPWVDRAQSLDEMDCWGLVILYHKHVLGIDLPIIDGYSSGECSVSDGAAGHMKLWEQVANPSENGVAFMAFDGDKPAHVGMMISATKMLHSRGCKETGGSVSIHSLQAMKSRYNRIEFYVYKGCHD
jgi:cell wall-associated NlpC family hydrolase